MIAAIVPVKSLAASKSRLLPALDRASLERLSVAMLEDVVDALLGVASLDRVAVVTPDPQVAAAMRTSSAEVLLRDVAGLNPSIDAAADELAREPGDATLVVLGDVAGARSDELGQLVEACEEPGVALAPSSDGGTSALLRRPARVIPSGFGPDSAARHRALASAAGVPFTEIALASLAVDVDERDDLLKLANLPFVGARTRALLTQLLPELAP